MKQTILLIGGGGHCRSCIEVIESTGKYKISGIVDSNDKVGKSVLGYKVVGTDDDLPLLLKKYKNAIITLGQIKSAGNRIKILQLLKEHNANLPVIVSSTARVSRHAMIGCGTIIMHNSIVNAGAVVGENCIINTSSVVEHDVIINDHCHISTGAIVNGTCNIGSNVFIGSRSVIANNLNIYDDVVIGSGSVVIRDLTTSGIYAGVPARKIK